jgi:hypothetical protein
VRLRCVCVLALTNSETLNKMDFQRTSLSGGEILRSSLGQEGMNPGENFTWFRFSFRTNSRKVPQTGQRLVTFTFLTIYYSLISQLSTLYNLSFLHCRYNYHEGIS